MARQNRRPGRSLLVLSLFTLLTGLLILLMAWWPLHQQSTREILTHTGTLEQHYAETHPSGRSTVTYYCFVVDGETYYVSPIVWRALDRGGVAALEPGTQLHLTYWADMPARQLERDASLSPVSKTKLRFGYGHTRFEIDIYPFSREKAVLFVYGDGAELPEDVSVLREVTGDVEYKNRSLAARNIL